MTGGAPRGPWAPEFGPLAAEAPDLLAAYLTFARVPWRTRRLPVALKELVCVAASASITHLYPPAVRMHVAGALRAGAPRSHVVQALAIASRLGMRAAATALPIVADEAGVAVADAVRDLAPALADAWDGVLAAEGAGDDGLPLLDQELIAVAAHASGATLDVDGTRRHVRAALAAGATVEQLVEVIGLVSALGLHGCLVGAAELAAHDPASAQPGAQSSATPLDSR